MASRSLLPVLPSSTDAVKAAQVLAIEARITKIVAELDDIEQLEDWRARARALEGYLRSPELQRPMLGAQRRIEGRIGQLLGEPKHGVTNPGYELVPSDDHRRDFRLLARALSGDCTLTDDEWRKTRVALVALVRFRLGLQPVTPPLPDGTYHCIVADPPWQLETGPNAFGTREAGNQPLAYSQMTLDAIRELEVERLAAPDAHLYLWTTNRYVEEAYGIARAWGFRPSALLVWCKKPRGIGLGDTFRLTTEFVLFARRGNLTARRIVERTWFEWPRGAHSVKPAGFYTLVESVTPPPYLDMFGRKRRPRWDVWGAEAPAIAETAS